MPRLDANTAKSVSSQETTSFEPIPEGVYTVRLREVEARESRQGSPYWAWVVEVDGGDHDGRRLWINTSLKDSAHWKLKEVFDAFGFTTDSDTDEIVGERMKVAVTQRTIEGGARAGQLGNNVERCMPLGASDKADDDDAF